MKYIQVDLTTDDTIVRKVKHKHNSTLKYLGQSSKTQELAYKFAKEIAAEEKCSIVITL